MDENRRRVRVTLRCLVEDLGLAVPDESVEMLPDHPMVDEALRHAGTAPAGLKRIGSIGFPPVFRLQFSRWRGAVWVDEQEDILWLLAVGFRRARSEDDAFEHFKRLNEDQKLLPTSLDRLRDRVEEAARLLSCLPDEVDSVLSTAREHPGDEVAKRVAGKVSVRVLVEPGTDLETIWVAVSCLDAKKQEVPPPVRDVIFAHFELAAGPGIWDEIGTWLGDRPLKYFECARFGVTEKRAQ